jgi:crossover junction endodeoxyribonuclease RusA
MNGTLHFAVSGKPISQGSMTHVGGGRMVHSPELIAWRKKVAEVALLHARQTGWVLPLDEPVMIAAKFYLPRPTKPRFPVPATKPDLDKLQRAIGDALAPKKGMGVLAEDSRIVKWLDPEKVYARPGEERVEITIIRQEVPF